MYGQWGENENTAQSLLSVRWQCYWAPPSWYDLTIQNVRKGGKKRISHWFKSERDYTVLTAFNLCNLQFSVSGVVHSFGTAFTDIQKYVWITSKIFIGVCVNDYDPTLKLKLLGKVIKQVEIWSADSSSSTTANLSHALPLSCTSPQTVKLWKVLSGSDTRRSMINDRHG